MNHKNPRYNPKLVQISPVLEEAGRLVREGHDFAADHQYESALANARQIRGLDVKLRIYWHDGLHLHVIRQLLERGNLKWACELVELMQPSRLKDAAFADIARSALVYEEASLLSWAICRIESNDLKEDLEARKGLSESLLDRPDTQPN